MAWGKVCDTLHAHRKVAKAGWEAMGLWVEALSWSRDKGTEGFIPADRPVKLHPDEDEDAAAKGVAALVKAKLWEPVEGGWRFHDWYEIQDSAADRAAKYVETSQKRAEAGRLGGLAKASKAKQLPDELANGGNSSPSPLPTSPLPTNPDPGGSAPTAPARGTAVDPPAPPAAPPSAASPPPEEATKPRTRSAAMQASLDRIRCAYDAGISDGSGQPFASKILNVPPHKDPLFVLTKAHGKADGKQLTGPELDAWVRKTAAEFRRAIPDEDGRFYSHFNPDGCLSWLNAGRARGLPFARAPSPAVQPPARNGEQSWTGPTEI